jgi:hypothetical protein
MGGHVQKSVPRQGLFLVLVRWMLNLVGPPEAGSQPGGRYADRTAGEKRPADPIGCADVVGQIPMLGEGGGYSLP